MSANRVDWQNIKQTVEASGYDGREPFLFVMPHYGRHLLLAIMERLEWPATFRDFGYDFSDWDELQAIVAETHAGLMWMEQVNLIVAKLEEIRQAIEDMGATGSDDALIGILAALDPRLAALVATVDAIENVLGGDYEPPPLLPPGDPTDPTDPTDPGLDPVNE